MEYTQLGRSGLKVSRICLGTMNFGPFTTQEDSFEIMDHALAQGVQFFDTACGYGGEKGRGATEEIIGRWLKQGGGRREKIVLATKVYGKMGEGPNDEKLSAYNIRQSCEASLRRLQTDHIDLFQMHHVDRATPWEEIWQAMEQLVREGKVIYVGSSNFAGWHLARAQHFAEKRNFLGLISEQSIYNLRNRFAELDVIPAAEELGIGVIPWSPLGGGLLGGVLEKSKEGRRTRPALVESVEKLKPQIEAYETLCKEIGAGPGNVALAWLLSRPGVTSPIIGPRTMEQFKEQMEALNLKLSPETLAKLDAIWPAPGFNPGKPSPEAYAW